MVKAPSEAVRPSLNVTIHEKTNENSLSHHGETAMDVEGQNKEDSLDKREEQSSSSTDKRHRRLGLGWVPLTLPVLPICRALGPRPWLGAGDT